ncbi:glycoside hydrolase [Mycolicibacterium mageritense DSM 44476 = CIP 104973]|uniref:Glycosyl hydrolase n=1 Tax=Mycolicibacterium mageritense TaxID=53462 RepID=A0ABM7HKF2_MYCME|nr:glycosyl hydrolase family 65 protein [Mycolicibacterium mageritense]MCC9185111.1 glycoside hydrolase family 65 protein [Mycolicibacterium mageritense]BBX30967.1 glycosyl hydrolase [Mycolicibacterium mageritense]CDO24717.1 glycosyl hydrolase [Mycolicibacterium mageritense DSM 44476 = CIP 104973]
MLNNMLADEAWLIRESGHEPARANYFETVFTVGNGRLGTRGSLEEGHRGEWSGTYLGGVYDAWDCPDIDLVNVPDWLWLEVEVAGVRLDVQSSQVLHHERALDISHGLLWRNTLFEDSAGRRTRVESVRFASMFHRSLCGMRVEVTPENHSSPIAVVSGINGHRRNLERMPAYPPGTVFSPETRWEKWAHTKHLSEVGRNHDGDRIYLEMRTIDSDITVGCASTTSVATPARRTVLERYEQIAERFDVEVVAGEPIVLDKLVSFATSRDYPGPAAHGADVRNRCTEVLDTSTAAGLDACLAASCAVWDAKWTSSDCVIGGDESAAKAVRFSIYHLLIAANEHDPTVNIGAKSLSGEGYRGHVFWDTEIMMLPFFIYTQPDTARALLSYRYHTLDGARSNAHESGNRGARFAWESADTGREVCPIWTVDGVDRLWMRDEELHVGADVAYGVMTYVAATGDIGFLVDHGAEILFETSRFWIDRLHFDATTGRYHLNTVMGPDEFHIHVDDNAFTNRLVRWNLEQAVATYDMLRDHHRDGLADLAVRIGLEADEVAQWRECAANMADLVESETGVIEQFRGYFDLQDVPVTTWDDNDMPQYPDGYHHFNCENTTLLKQPDVVMMMYLLPDAFSRETKRVNFEYYEARTLHKSSLSPSIHAIMGIEVGDFTRAEQYFARSAFVDLTDNQGNTAEGMHIASAGGTWQTVVCGFGGFRIRDGAMSFDPWLPPTWEHLGFRLRWHGGVVAVTITHDDITLQFDGADTDVAASVQGREVILHPGEPVRVRLHAERYGKAPIPSV